jgi:hypothetical protein
MAGGERRRADHVDVMLNRHLRGLARRLEQGARITSKPKSVNAEDTKLAPRSCPSWPILATMILGLRPSRSATERVPSSACFQRPSRRAVP